MFPSHCQLCVYILLIHRLTFWSFTIVENIFDKTVNERWRVADRSIDCDWMQPKLLTDLVEFIFSLARSLALSAGHTLVVDQVDGWFRLCECVVRRKEESRDKPVSVPKDPKLPSPREILSLLSLSLSLCIGLHIHEIFDSEPTWERRRCLYSTPSTTTTFTFASGIRFWAKDISSEPVTQSAYVTPIARIVPCLTSTFTRILSREYWNLLWRAPSRSTDLLFVASHYHRSVLVYLLDKHRPTRPFRSANWTPALLLLSVARDKNNWLVVRANLSAD